MFFSSLKIARQILDAHSSMLNMSLIDAKMQYIRNWQALQGFGITYFVIKSGKSKKDVRREGWKREGGREGGREGWKRGEMEEGREEDGRGEEWKRRWREGGEKKGEKGKLHVLFKM